MSEPTTMRESLEEVVEQIETESPAPASDNMEFDFGDTEAPAADESAAEARPSRSRDEQGRFAPKAAETAPAPEVAKPETPAIQPGPKSGPRPEPQERAPVSWRPEVREHWAALPPAVRSEVARREQEVQRTLQETAEARKYVDAINRVVAPYEMFIRAENSNPLQAIDNMMSTAARLRTGTGPETATLIAQLVNQFGVGRFGQQFIQTLDSALAGQTPRVDQTQQAVQQALQQQLAPVQQFMSQFQQAQEQSRQRAAQEAQGEVQSFLEQAEFGEDVREDMADIMELAQRRGRSVSLQEAYRQACMAHPEVRSALQSRARSRGAQASSGAVQRAKAAAVSVTGGPALSAPQEPASANIRSAIESAIAANSR